MRPSTVKRGPPTLTLVVVVAAACLAATVHAARDRAPRALGTARGAVNADAVRLGRAALERSLGNLRGVVENLEPIDFSAEPDFAEADRAAFLLGQAYLELGSVDRFAALARQVGGWKHRSVYTRWLAFQLLVAEAEGARPATPADSAAGGSTLLRFGRDHDPEAGPAADALAAAVLIRGGNAEAAQRLIDQLEARKRKPTPLVIYFKALALGATLREDESEWIRLSRTDTTTTLGRDLVGASVIRRATYALARGEDPRPLLATMPAGSRFAARARHMAGLAALERGDEAEGTAVLESLLASDSAYAGRREVLMALAGRELDRGRWALAHQGYRRVDADWASHRAALARQLETRAFEPLWSAWESNSPFSDAVILDALPAEMLAGQLTTGAADLSTRPATEIPELTAPASLAPPRWPVAPPPASAWNAVSASARQVGEAGHDLERTRWALERERERLEALRRYLGSGRTLSAREIAELEARVAFLDSLRLTLDRLDRRLREVRDRATRHVVMRAMQAVQGCIDDLLWLEGMRHFHLDGPLRARGIWAPPGYPDADSLLHAEEALARAVRRLAEGLAADAPGLIARSYERGWRPGMIDRIHAQSEAAHRDLAWARALGATIDSALAAAGTSAEIRRLEGALAAEQRRVDSLRVAHRALRDSTAAEAVRRALATLDQEREGIDYGLATSAYGASVGLGLAAATDSLASDSVSAGPAGPGAVATSDADRPEDPETLRWRAEAIADLRGFLERHPGSPARGEMRFRLADLLLVDARAQFQADMARYLAEPSAGRGAGAPLPVLSHQAALDLYRKILAQDRTFEHLDAVQFNTAMILADEGNPEAERFFDDLVTEHPRSPYVQESQLRLGDMRFDAKRFLDAVGFYQKAATGPDTALQVIALYKMGWAHYNEDRFAESADAFRAVLDLYVARPRGLQVDVEDEAAAYLVHSLAGAGGARAFAEYFDRVGHRPYEMRILMAMGQEYRRLGRYPEAVAADQLCVERYPQQADALVSAQRLIETQWRAERPDSVSAARLALAPRFAPGSAWFEAQTSDSVRAAAAEFARGSWMTVARERHLRAREAGSQDDWRAAHQLYETVLNRWPRDPEAPALEMAAGEAGAQLGDYPNALRHFGAAAAAGSDSLAAEALWQRVAVSDAWYEKSRGGQPAAGTPGSDSLARAVVTAADVLLERFPRHPHAADLVWRQGNLDFAHGWNDRAARDLERMVTQHPDDPRAPQAAILRADALLRAGDYQGAGGAYEQALTIAQRAHVDSLARRAAQAIPITYYRHAEAAVAADSSQFARNAALFEQVATRWPTFEHADVAQYRAGLSYQRGDSVADAVRAFDALITRFPKSSYVRDAHLRIAQAWETHAQPARAALAYRRFTEAFPADSSVKDAWLKSADLYAAAGQEALAEERRLAYIAKYPDDIETAMEILEALARRELATVGPGHPISALLPPPPPPPAAARKAGKRGAAKTATKAKAPAEATARRSHLAEYLRYAEAHPQLQSRDLVAQVRFLQAEEANATYLALALPLPLDRSIAAKQQKLDQVMALYKQSVDVGVPGWAHGSALRIGQALVAFGDALEKSERPADLKGDDLAAYEDVVLDKAQVFRDRGEAVWADLLKQQKNEEKPDTWVTQAQTALWGRLGNRFYYQPETDFPLVAATPAPRIKVDKKHPDRAAKRTRGDSSGARAQIPQEGGQP